LSPFFSYRENHKNRRNRTIFVIALFFYHPPMRLLVDFHASTKHRY
jgi:hypothetical protein